MHGYVIKRVILFLGMYSNLKEEDISDIVKTFLVLVKKRKHIYSF